MILSKLNYISPGINCFFKVNLFQVTKSMFAPAISLNFIIGLNHLKAHDLLVGSWAVPGRSQGGHRAEN